MADSRRQSTSSDARRQSVSTEQTKSSAKPSNPANLGAGSNASNLGNNGRPYRGSNTATKQATDSYRRQSMSNGGPRISNMGGKGPRSSRTATGSRVNVASSGFPMDRVQVIDDGFDRTPKPLILLKPTVMKGVPGLSTEYDSHTPTSDVSENFLDRISSSGFGRGAFSTGTSGTQTPLADDEEDYQARKNREREQAQQWQEQEDVDADQGNRWTQDEVQADKPLTEEDLDRSVYISLTETDATFLLEIAGVSVHVEGEDAKKIEENNARYQSLLTAKEGSDKFVAGTSQTLTVLKKNKEVQMASAAKATVACQVSLWDIANTYAATVEATATTEEQQSVSIMAAAAAVGTGSSVPAGGGLVPASGGSASASLRQSRCDAGYPGRSSYDQSQSQSMVGGAGPGRQQASMAGAEELAGTVGGDAEQQNVLHGLHGLPEALAIMDAAITQNIYLEKLLMYRDVKPFLLAEEAVMSESALPSTPSVSGSEVQGAGASAQPSAVWDDMAPQASTSSEQASSSSHVRTELLWQWKCDLTQGRNASCMCWNKARPDLLAVGYGSFDFGSQHEGLVAFWSLKNPDYPLWTFTTSSGVMSLDFANHSPNILAVGLYDGKLAVYDVKNKQALPAMESNANNGKHSDPVWKVRWLDRGQEREEVLVSISTDGRVTQWSITKGLEFTDLMKLKRVVRRNNSLPTGKGAASAQKATDEQEAFISRLTSGMSFDFSSKDDRIYVAGTEDGWIHKCSTSYSEQYLESYQGHMGPVYQVQWSPYKHDFFLSCGGDWTMRLWQEQRNSSLVVFQSANDEINDVQWSPFSSTMFGAATAGGRLEIWDFADSTLKPVASHSHPGCKLSCVLFSPTSPVVMCGGNDGAVSVHRIHYAGGKVPAKAEQVRLMDEALRANVMKEQPSQMAA